ncbi:MAG: hypothetical protein Q8Q33_02550 [Chlamydiota bacterium]|nr:hypothetical protein [Chlamydiota bacterium]
MNNKFFDREELLTPPIKRATYSDRTAWLMSKMSRLAYFKFEKNEDELTKLKEALSEADFEWINFEGR